MLNDNDSAFVMQYAQESYSYWTQAAVERCRPFMLLRPRISRDGNQWCVLYGENLMDGVCGFGDTPELAAADFDKNWHEQRLGVCKSTETPDV
jgi:hypothetical protein